MLAEAAAERITVPRQSPLQSISLLLPQPQRPDPPTNLVAWVVGDIATLLAAAAATVYIQSFVGPRWAAPMSTSALWNCFGYVFLQAVLVTLIAYTEGAYGKELFAEGNVAALLAKSLFWSTVIVALAAGNRCLPLLLLTGCLGYAGMLTIRVSCRRMFRQTPSTKSRHVLIVGANKNARDFASYLAANPTMRKAAVGFLDDYWPVGDDILGRVADLEHISRAHFVDELIVAADDPATRRRAVRTAKACRLDVALIPNLADCDGANTVAQIGRWPLITVHEERPPVLALAMKRAVDLVGAVIGLLLTAPLSAAIAFWIKLDSPGPVLYSAPRVGCKGARFRCYKFRTMSANADAIKRQMRVLNEREGPFFKIACDPRITRCGRWLRKYSLDELPQLWNVLRGDMSLVGPRPHPLDDFAGYQLADFCRLDVRPGMTGLWQTTARRDPSFQTSMRLDKEYIERWNLSLDFRILLKTFRVVVAGGGC